MGTFSRVRYVVAANLNALLEKAEDPEKLLRALVREMEDAGEDARQATADLLAEQQHLERLHKRLTSESTEWQERAERAVDAGRDDLARAALSAKAEKTERIAAVAVEQDQLRSRLSSLETDMTTLKSKLAEAKSKLKSMQTRESVRQAKPAPEERLSRNERKIRNAMGRFDRLQSQVERLEARVQSYEFGEDEVSPWASKNLSEPADPLIEEELAALKSRLSGNDAKPVESMAKEGKLAPAAEADKA